MNDNLWCSTKNMVFKHFIKSAGKLMCRRQFFYKVAGLQPANLLKEKFRHSCFPVNFTEFWGTIILKNNFGKLLLNLWYLHARPTWKRLVSRKPSCKKPFTLPRIVFTIHIFLRTFKKTVNGCSYSVHWKITRIKQHHPMNFVSENAPLVNIFQTISKSHMDWEKNHVIK